MEKESKDLFFYDALKNAQPLAFLASFSIIIGIISFSNIELSKIHQDAIIAGVMFILSFIMSLLFQLFSKSGLADLAKYTKYFFLAVGIFHLLHIVTTFGSLIDKIPIFVAGWLFFVLGAVTFIQGYTRQKTVLMKKKLFWINYKLSPIIMGSGLLIIGIPALFVAFTGEILPFDWVWLLIIGIPLALFGMVLRMISEQLIFKKYY